MKLFLLVALTMVAFAANSVLNRFALAEGAIDPAGFAVIRLVSGALMLGALVLMQGTRAKLRFRPLSVVSLALYVVGFSFAYVSLDTGMGALLLFGGVQVTMFVGAAVAGENLPLRRIIGGLVAFGGLVVLLLPSGAAPLNPVGAFLMIAAAFGWGIYSLLGRGSPAPMANTAANFIYAVPLGVLTLFVGPLEVPELSGVVLAVISGAITSGLGYALWYHVLPRLASSVAAIAQLTVPLIALAGGVLFLGEDLTLRFLVASILVMAGVVLGLPAVKFRRTG